MIKTFRTHTFMVMLSILQCVVQIWICFNLVTSVFLWDLCCSGGEIHIFCVCKPGQKYFQQSFGQFNSGPRLSTMATDTTRHSQRGRDFSHEIPCNSASSGIFGSSGEWLVKVTSLPRPQSRKRCRVTLVFVKTTSNRECKDSTKCCGFCGHLWGKFYRTEKHFRSKCFVSALGAVDRACWNPRKSPTARVFVFKSLHSFSFYWHRHVVCLAPKVAYTIN